MWLPEVMKIPLGNIWFPTSDFAVVAIYLTSAEYFAQTHRNGIKEHNQ